LLARTRLRGDADILLGDMEEEFHDIACTDGLAAARRWYTLQTVRSLPGFMHQQADWLIIMFLRHARVAVRTLRKKPLFTAINTTGLAVGLACCLLLALYVQDELSFDRFHVNADELVRLERIQPGSDSRSAFTDGPSACDIAQQYPEVVAATRTFREESLISVGNIQFTGERIAYVDSTYLSMFSFPLLAGDRRTALAAPQSIVLTESLARKYFGTSDPVGRQVRVNNEWDMTVTGVVEDVPYNSHYRFDALASFSTAVAKYPYLERYGSISLISYLQLAPGVDREALEQKLVTFAEEHDNFASAMPLRPITDIHLHSQVYEIDPQGDIRMVYVFGGTALLILLLACMNFVNLSTARASTRYPEVGMRKILGADRTQLVLQYLGESSILIFLAIACAVGLVFLLTPFLAGYLDRPLEAAEWVRPRGLLVLFGLGAVLSVVAGTWPALKLAHFNPVDILARRSTGGSAQSRTRRVLIVTQFVISMVMIAVTAVVAFQFRYMNALDPGFDANGLVNVPLHDAALLDRVVPLKTAFLADTGVERATHSNTGVGEFSWSTFVDHVDSDGEETSELAGFIFVDEDFLDTYGLGLMAGTPFRTSEEGILVNESFVRKFGWESPLDAVDQTVSVSGSPVTIIGVVEDFNIRAYTATVPPVILLRGERRTESLLTLRLRPGDESATLARLAATWASVVPDWPFEAEFVSSEIARRHARFAREGRLFATFTALALLLACLGLFGLTAFVGQQRRRELGIRKVVGASTQQLVVLLSREMTVLVAVAFVLALPLMWYSMDTWLSRFAYRIPIDWTMLVLPGIVAVALAWLTVGYQSWQASRQAPVELMSGAD
jgi:putative ABC transport system permease protein